MLNVRISQRSRLLVPTSGLRLRCSRQSLGKGGRATIKVTRSHKRKGRKKSPGQTFFFFFFSFFFRRFYFFSVHFTIVFAPSGLNARDK